MLNKTAMCLARKLLRHRVIQEESLDVYVYGFELLLSFLFTTLLIIAIGLILQKGLETIAFLVVFILLRSYSGGYHASKYYICTLVTISVFSIVMLLSHFVTVSIVAYPFLGVSGLIALFALAPIENPNKEITPKRKTIYKYVSIGIFLAFLAFGILMNSYVSVISSTVFYTLCADIILMFPCIFKKGEKTR